jgi:hypothetical protein
MGGVNSYLTDLGNHLLSEGISGVLADAPPEDRSDFGTTIAKRWVAVRIACGTSEWRRTGMDRGLACRRRGSLLATTLDVCDPVVATTGVPARGEHKHRSRVVPALTRRCLRRAAAKEPPGFTMIEEETTRS